ncbi:MAG: Omp28-related outer membrane protein [Ignavibacteriae bacterium]|nr:Omp28-related outer membrane protein [Ignavibacteriota bacterium]MCB9243840.1 Omp28-related outer membrane protein [Ignavibacteriales bacterium]
MKKLRSLIIILILMAGSTVFYSCESNDSTVYPTANTTPPLTLLLPSNNSTINTTGATFDWTDLPNAIAYGLQVATDVNFTNLAIDSTGFTASRVDLDSGRLADNTTYYWRVRGIRTADTTSWTSSNNFSVQVASVSANNKVLVEMFTNTSCIPCVQANTYLDKIQNLEGITNNDADVVMIRYHSTLYPNDPFYLFNTSANDARQSYYNGGIFNPYAFLDGTFMGNYSSSAWTSLINNNFGTLTSYAFTYNNSYNTSNRQGTFNVTVNQITGTQVGDLVMHVAVTEDELMYNAPNGETEFNNVLRDLLTPGTGEMVNVSAGGSASFTYNYTLNSQINDNNAHIIMFLQSSGTKQVYAVEIEKIR